MLSRRIVFPLLGVAAAVILTDFILQAYLAHALSRRSELVRQVHAQADMARAEAVSKASLAVDLRTQLAALDARISELYRESRRRVPDGGRIRPPSSAQLRTPPIVEGSHTTSEWQQDPVVNDDLGFQHHSQLTRDFPNSPIDPTTAGPATWDTLVSSTCLSTTFIYDEWLFECNLLNLERNDPRQRERDLPPSLSL